MTTQLIEAPLMDIHSAIQEVNDAVNRQQIELMKATICKGTTDDEFKLFLHVVKKTGLDPFAKQIYAIKRGGTMTIQTGIDGYRVIAQRTGKYAGNDDAIYGELINGKYPSTATVTVYRIVQNTRCAFTSTARWDEYKQGNGNSLSSMWAKMPYLMLAKCAESLALRKAFPAELSGIYTKEEMMQADCDEVTGEIIEPPKKPIQATTVTPSFVNAPKAISKITTNQESEILELVSRTNSNLGDLLDHLKIKALADMPAHEYLKIVAGYQKKIKQQEGAIIAAATEKMNAAMASSGAVA